MWTGQVARLVAHLSQIVTTHVAEAQAEIEGAKKAIKGGARGQDRRSAFGQVRDAKQRLVDVRQGAAMLREALARKALQDQTALMDKIVGDVQVTQNFTGPITMNQDFRGEDPDRIAFAITERLIRASEHRTMSRTAPAMVGR